MSKETPEKPVWIKFLYHFVFLLATLYDPMIVIDKVPPPEDPKKGEPVSSTVSG